MRRLFSTFAHGAPGIGLLLLRLATGSALICPVIPSLLRQAAVRTRGCFTRLLSYSGVLLLAGLWTPIAGALVALVALWEMVSHSASGHSMAVDC